MPSKKGRRIASRQTQMRHRTRRNAPHLTTTQLQGPTEDNEPVNLPEDNSEELGKKIGTATTPAASTPATKSPRVRREQQVITLQAGPPMRVELMRIGILAFVIGIMVITLRFATDLSA